MIPTEGWRWQLKVLVAAVPYARLSEYRGKKFVIALSLVGLILSCVWMAVVRRLRYRVSFTLVRRLLIPHSHIPYEPFDQVGLACACILAHRWWGSDAILYGLPNCCGTSC